MSEFNAGKAIEESEMLQDQAKQGYLIIPLSAAILAVLAAVASLLAHHSSTFALAVKNDAVLFENKASSQYLHYETKQVDAHLYDALLMANRPPNRATANKMVQMVDRDNADASTNLKSAQQFDEESQKYSSEAEAHMQVNDTEEVAATLFEVSIVLVSISALTRTRALLYAGGVLTLAGLFYLINGIAGR
ncbi:MAG: DUF4337 family protein [Candidatus Eremiobacteraeota bacterium]|nr:DUF4337 family protein [Candidatus Eremiobacteraeota bacterium]